MSGLEINYGEDNPDVETYDVQERLALTEDGRVVPEEHEDARWLYAIPGRPIPMADAIKHGLVDLMSEKPAASSEPSEPKAAAGKRGRRIEKKA